MGGKLPATPLGNLNNHIMKKKVFIFILLFSVKSLIAQGILTVTTNKTNYAYGDSIVVRVTITNNTDTSFTLIGSSTCFMRIKFNDIRLSPMCTLDQREFFFSAGMSRTWIWYLYPKDHGIPNKEGVQKIVGSCGNLSDSVYINAPKYRGGVIAVGLKESISASVYQSLRDSMNATLIYSSLGPKVYEYWRVVNHSIDSLVEKYSQDYRLDWIIVKRTLEFNKHIVTSIKSNPIIPSNFSLSQNYPNPFNPKTRINFEVPQKTQIDLTIYDVKGSIVLNLLKGEYLPGQYSVDFDGSSLSSGVYYYQLKSFTGYLTKKMLLLK
ncbi:MAG: T9SS C-terminal target domain-containing protein [Ignavibacteriales bacterium]|nr:MAG: T9SS C-terminal target domain-containing protein [Ignavibacteriales bacterium]